MISENLKKIIISADSKYKGWDKTIEIPEYSPKTHVIDLANNKYFHLINVLRHFVKSTSDDYFGNTLGGYNVDLFMLTPSVSSPAGPGSDSETIKIKFGNLITNLVDSSQFGFEPLLMNGFDLVYCYLPSMRGENPDKRHLNQFYHCEAEMKGRLYDLIPMIENYIKCLAKSLLLQSNILSRLSQDPELTNLALNNIISTKRFHTITFDDSIKILEENGYKHLINYTSFGNDISAEGELKLAELLSYDCPFWITHFHRDRVPFYQKPDRENKNRVLNADLIFPCIKEGSFGGEIVGCGQRQDLVDEMYESLNRQSVNSENYEWYINLRRMESYSPTSGFGIGIERFITWALVMDDIKNVILYPRLKNIQTYP